MRGIQLVQFHPSDPRFIPAGAGNTERFQRRSVGPSVYPRWRGEHIGGHIMPRQSDGLSPLARGTLNVVRRRRWKSRFIPAGAGNTWLGRSQNSGSAVYPRWRGEHFARSIAISPDHGLSPLARGTRYKIQRCLLFWRFIPAGAGNTPPHA